MFNSIASLSYLNELDVPKRGSPSESPEAVQLGETQRLTNGPKAPRKTPHYYTAAALKVDAFITGLLIIATIGSHFLGASGAVQGALIATTVAYGLWTIVRYVQAKQFATKSIPLRIETQPPDPEAVAKAEKEQNRKRHLLVSIFIIANVALILLGIKLCATDTLLHGALISAGSVGLGYAASTVAHAKAQKRLKEKLEEKLAEDERLAEENKNKQKPLPGHEAPAPIDNNERPRTPTIIDGNILEE